MFKWTKILDIFLVSTSECCIFCINRGQRSYLIFWLHLFRHNFILKLVESYFGIDFLFCYLLVNQARSLPLKLIYHVVFCVVAVVWIWKLKSTVDYTKKLRKKVDLYIYFKKKHVRKNRNKNEKKSPHD